MNVKDHQMRDECKRVQSASLFNHTIFALNLGLVVAPVNCSLLKNSTGELTFKHYKRVLVEHCIGFCFSRSFLK